MPIVRVARPAGYLLLQALFALPLGVEVRIHRAQQHHMPPDERIHTHSKSARICHLTRRRLRGGKGGVASLPAPAASATLFARENESVVRARSALPPPPPSPG